MPSLEFSLYYPTVAALLVTILAVLLRANVGRGWAIAVAIGAVGCFFAILYLQYQIPYDYKLFWLCGKDVIAGRDYYAIDPRQGRQLVLNPPTAMPLFELFASCSLRKGARIWTIANAIAALALVPLAYRVVQGRLGDAKAKLSPAILGVLTAAIVLSQATLSNLALGQLSILTTLAIFLALRAQERGRPILAGVCLTVASVKVVTMLPFLLLFTRKRDLPTWLTMIGLGLGLCLMTGTAAELPGRLQNNFRDIQAMAEEGRVNDYSFAGPSHTSMIALDHALYRLGLRDRGRIGLLQFAAVAVLGLFVAKIALDPRCPRGASVSLISLYSAVFFYHRIYDAVILSLPLVYCTGLARNLPPRASRPFALGASCLIAILYMYQRFLVIVETISHDLGVWGRIMQAVVLPASCWSVLLAIVCVSFGLHRQFGSRISVGWVER